MLIQLTPEQLRVGGTDSLHGQVSTFTFRLPQKLTGSFPENSYTRYILLGCMYYTLYSYNLVS